MPQEVLESASAAQQARWQPNQRLKNWILRGLVLAAVLVGAGMLTLAMKWPFTEQALIDVLQERSVRSVEITTFRKTFFPPGCVAEGIRFLHRKHENKPPLITIEKLTVQGSYWGLIEPRKHLATVRLYGMHITVPPPNPNGGPNPIMPLTRSDTGPSVVIGTVSADGAVLDFMQRTPGRAPLRLGIDKLAIDGVGNNRPLNYRALIRNPEPPGTIESEGKFGTWNPDEPAATPVNGWYRFTNADLGFFKKLSGKLTSIGKFQGTLGQIQVTGRADVPNFHVVESSHTRDLAADFHATVAATDGNVVLDSVNARFDRTSVACSGSIAGEKGDQGKTVSLTIYSMTGRIEDLFNLVTEDKRPAMTGNVNFMAQLQVPPKQSSFLQAMRVDGKFGVSSGRFTDSDIQSSLKKISNSAAKKGKAPLEDAATFVSALGGSVVVRDGVAHLSALDLSFPGGRAWMNGTYSLLTYDIDLHGKLETDGSPSAATTGFKSFLLKAMTPFLKKKGGRQVVPFKIGGNYRKVNMGLDLHHKS